MMQYLNAMCGRIIQASGPLRYKVVDGLDVPDRRLSNIPRRYNGIKPKAEIRTAQPPRCVGLLQSTLDMPAASARAFPSASICSEMSSTATRAAGPTARANSSVVAPQPQPMSSTRSPRRGAAKASNASVIGAKVMWVCSFRASTRDGSSTYSGTYRDNSQSYPRFG
jgi:hypothetical protein